MSSTMSSFCRHHNRNINVVFLVIVMIILIVVITIFSIIIFAFIIIIIVVTRAFLRRGEGGREKCLQKLQGTKGSEVDREVNTRFSGAMSRSKAAVECRQSENARPSKVSPSSNPVVMQRNHRRMFKFTSNEDDCLKQGINRHGFSQWTAILRDPDCIFQEGRTADFLKNRTHSMKFL